MRFIILWRKPQRERAIEKYRISAALHLPVWHWIEDEGVDPQRILQGIGVSAEEVRQPDCLLTSAQHYQLMHNLLAFISKEAFGLETGRRSRLCDIGVLGLTMLCAPDVRTAIEVGVKYAPIAGALGKLWVDYQGDDIVIAYRAPVVSADLRAYLSESQLATVYAYFWEMLPGAGGEAGEASLLTRAKEVSFDYPEPDCSDLYREFFDCPITFDAPECRMVVDQSLAAQAPAFANELTFLQCTEVCARLYDEAKEEPPLIRQARELIAKSPAKFASLTALVKELGISPRTFQRHLADSGLTFTCIHTEVRFALACDLLQNPALTIEQIAALLGYSEPSNFRRAFKRLYNLTPTEFRKSVKGR